MCNPGKFILHTEISLLYALLEFLKHQIPGCFGLGMEEEHFLLQYLNLERIACGENEQNVSIELKDVL